MAARPSALRTPPRSNTSLARADTNYDVGDQLRVTLPVVGTVVAEIRWTLGGRIGCELTRPIDLASYYDLLAALVRGS